jgi:Flp pilus assembly pilin Flp
MRATIDLWHDEEAVATVEYALLLATVVAASIGAWTALGESVRSTVTETATLLEQTGQ